MGPMQRSRLASVGVLTSHPGRTAIELGRHGSVSAPAARHVDSVEQQKIPSSVRSGIGKGHAAPMGLFSRYGRYYKHAAPNGAGAAAVQEPSPNPGNSMAVASPLPLRGEGCDRPHAHRLANTNPKFSILNFQFSILNSPPLLTTI